MLPLRRRRLPLPTGSRPAKGWPPLQLASPPLLAAAPCGRPTADPLCEHRATSGCAHERLSPQRASHNRPCPRVAIAPMGGASASLSGWPWL
ncbi:hypothetical protein GW17_00056711 [Ensete ventricosum]|nr:hypothetical protein GW17_00056711 [Ensete ventricosum]RZS08182.1 hypothetical protein BHM03_00039120 [Ensete ventricosum]